MKKLIALISILMLGTCTLLFGGCGDPYANISLSSSEDEIVLTIGDEESESKEVVLTVNNFSNKLLGDLSFACNTNVVKFRDVSTVEGKTKVTIVALHGGEGVVTATMQDGGIKTDFKVKVIEPIVNMNINDSYYPYVVKGEDAKPFETEKLINFVPTYTTEKDVTYSIEGEPVTEIGVLADDVRTQIDVQAVSVSNPNLSRTITFKVLEPLQSMKMLVGTEEIEEDDIQELVLNHEVLHKTQVKIEVVCRENDIVLSTPIFDDDVLSCVFVSKTKVGDVHTFTYDISCLKNSDMLQSIDFEEVIVNQNYYFELNKSFKTEIYSIPQSIQVNGQDMLSESLVVYESYSSGTRGTRLNLGMFPTNSKSSLCNLKIEYDSSKVTVVNQYGQNIESGTIISGNSFVYVRGVVLCDTALELTWVNGEMYDKTLSKTIPISVKRGAREILCDTNLVFTLDNDGSSADLESDFVFETDPADAELDNVSVLVNSANVSVTVDELNKRQLHIRPLSVGSSSFIVMLSNGITKTVDFTVICQLEEMSLVVDMPTPIQNPNVGEKRPTAVDRANVLEQIVIHKSINNEKPVPINFTYNPLNASIAGYTYNIEDSTIVRVINNNIIGLKEGETQVEVVVSYLMIGTDGAGKTITETKTQTFSFEVVVYVPVESFYYSRNSIEVADIQTVGYYKLSEATTSVLPNIYPAISTNGKMGNIVFTMSGDVKIDAENTNIIYNDFISFDKATGVITGRIQSDATPVPTTITATLIDYNNTFTTRIKINVISYELVEEIVVDNILDISEPIVLTTNSRSFQIIDHVNKSTAHNKNLIYSFIADEDVGTGKVKVDGSGLVSLDESVNAAFLSSFTGSLSGKIRIATEDSVLTEDLIPQYYIEIPVVVSAGTKENPEVISSKDQFLAINTSLGLKQYYRLSGIIDMAGVDFTPFGTLTGGIIGDTNSKIINLNLTKSLDSKMGLFSSIAQNAYFKSVTIEASVNATDDFAYAGVVAGTNYGTIENVTVILSNSVVESTRTEGQANFGGVAGINYGEIKTTEDTSMFVSGEKQENARNKRMIYAPSTSSLLNISKTNDTTSLYVGGIVGLNAGTIEYVMSDEQARFDDDTYACVLSISSLSANALGLIAGINEGLLTSLVCKGNLIGKNNIGGVAGIIRTATLSSSETIVLECVSDAFVVGDTNVGGFVGYMSGGEVDYCSVEIFDEDTAIDKCLSVLGKDSVGGFVGGYTGGEISYSSYYCFVTPQERNVQADEGKRLGAFCGLRTGVIDNGTNYTNAICGFGELSDEPPDSINLTIIGQNTGADSPKPTDEKNIVVSFLSDKLEYQMTNGVGSEVVLFTYYYQAKNTQMQSSLAELNKFNLGDYITTNVKYIKVETQSPRILRKTVNGFDVVGSGLASLKLISRYDPTVIKYVYVYVVKPVSQMTIFSASSGNEYRLKTGTSLKIRKEQYVTMMKRVSGNVVSAEGNIELVASNDYLVTSDSSNLKIQTLIDNIVLYCGISEAFDLDLSMILSVKIGDLEYVSGLFTLVNDVEYACIEGTKAVNIEYSTYSMYPSDILQINMFVDTDDVNEMITIMEETSSGNLKFNGAIDSGTVVVPTNGVVTFNIELANKRQVGTKEYVLLIGDRNQLYKKYITIEILPQQVESIISTYYSSIEHSSPLDEQSYVIRPGQDGLLKVEIVPNYSLIEWVEIANVGNVYNLQLELSKLDGGQYKRVSGAFAIQNGIRIPTSIISDEDGILQPIFMRAVMSTRVPDNTLLNMRVTTSTGEEKLFELLASQISRVEMQIDGNDGQETENKLYLARGCEYDVDLTLYGYDVKDLVVNTSNVALSYTLTNEKLSIKVSKNFTIPNGSESGGLEVSLSAYGSRLVDGIVSSSAVYTMRVYLVDYVVKSITFDGSTTSTVGATSQAKTFEIFKTSYLSSTDIKVSFRKGVSIIYDDTLPAVVQKVEELEHLLTTEGIITAYEDGEITGQKLTNNNFSSKKDYYSYSASRRAITVQKIFTEATTPFYFEFLFEYKYNNGVIVASSEANQFVQNFKFDVFQLSTNKTKIPVKNTEELKNMIAGNHYILVNDITLPNDFKPISTLVGGFDGNYHEIKINSNLEAGSESSVLYYGLFESIGEGALIENVIINVVGDSITINLTASDVLFGFISGDNNGIITNCEVTGRKVTVVASETTEYSGLKQFGGLAAINNGSITNSRFTLNSFTAKGEIAGICVDNYGYISSCYVRNSAITNSSSSISSKTAGLVVKNASNSNIVGSFVEGKKSNEANFYSNDSIAVLRAQSRLSGFVFENMGNISDCYSDIPILSGSYAGGFVYANDTNGMIKNCYSTSLLQLNKANSFPFIVEDGVVSTYGTIRDCFIVRSVNPWNDLNAIEGITTLAGVAEFTKESTYETFCFAEYGNKDKGIWVINRNKPTLVSAENVILADNAQKKYISSKLDTATNVVTFVYEEKAQGTKSNPYIITNAQQLEEVVLTTSVGNQNNKFYRIVSNIDYTDENGNYSKSNLYKIGFLGEIEGNGMTIKNFVLSSSETLTSAGFFSELGDAGNVGIIKDLSFEPRQINFPSASNVGVVAGQMTGSGLYNVTVNGLKDGTASGVVVTGFYRVGGLVGRMKNSILFTSKIVNCKASISVNATSVNQTADLTKINTSAVDLFYGKINIMEKTAISGGLVGYVESGIVNFSSTSGSAVFIGQVVGTMAGYVSQFGRLVDNTMTPTSNQYIRASFSAGGVVGINDGELIDNIITTSITTDYFSTVPLPAIYVGGIVGINTGLISYTQTGEGLTNIEQKITIQNGLINNLGLAIGKMTGGTFENVNISGDVKGRDSVGGMIGLVENTNLAIITIRNLSHNGTVFGTVAGGIIGKMDIKGYQTINTFDKFVQYGDITAIESAGGFVGKYTYSGDDNPSFGIAYFTNCRLSYNETDTENPQGIKIVVKTQNYNEIESNLRTDVIVGNINMTEDIVSSNENRVQYGATNYVTALCIIQKIAQDSDD